MSDIEEYKKYLLSTGAAPNEVEEYGSYLASQGEQAPAPAPTPEPSGAGETAGAALQGFGQGASFGYLPELQAMTGAGLSKILPESMGGGDESYEDLKKHFRQQDIQKQEESPWAYGAGGVGGALATLPAFGTLGAAAKGAGVGAKALQSAKAGATYGAITNPNRGPEDLGLEENLKQRAAQAGIGALAGGASEGLIAGAGRSIQATGDKLAKSAIVKQIGANAGQIKKIIKKGDFPRLEKFLNESKLLKLGKSVDDVADDSALILKEDGPKIGQIYDDVKADAEGLGDIGIGAPKIDGNELADDIVNKVKERFKTHPDRDSIVSAIEQKAAVLRDMGDDINIVDLHKYRMGLDEGVDWTKANREMPSMQKAMVDARNTVADKSKKVIDELDGIVKSDRGKELKELNEKFSSAALVNNISSQAVGRETAKAFMGAGVIGGGAGVGAGYAEYQRSGSAPKAIGAGLLTGIGVGAARKYGAPIGYGAGKMSRPVGQALEAVGSAPQRMGVGTAAPWVLMGRERE